MNSVPTGLWDWMDALGPGERLPVIIVATIMGVFVVVFVVACVCGTVYKMHKNRLEDGLKRELLDRGMSADEIVLVVRAKPTKKCGSALNSNMGGNAI